MRSKRSDATRRELRPQTGVRQETSPACTSVPRRTSHEARSPAQTAYGGAGPDAYPTVVSNVSHNGVLLRCLHYHLGPRFVLPRVGASPRRPSATESSVGGIQEGLEHPGPAVTDHKGKPSGRGSLSSVEGCAVRTNKRSLQGPLSCEFPSGNLISAWARGLRRQEGWGLAGVQQDANLTRTDLLHSARGNLFLNQARQTSRSPVTPRMPARQRCERGWAAAPYRAPIRSIGRAPRLPRVDAIPATRQSLIPSHGPHQARRVPPVRGDHRHGRYRQPPGRPTAYVQPHTLCRGCRGSCACTQCRASRDNVG